MFYIHIKKKINHKHYYGHTSNLQKRLNNHNNGLSIYTKKYLPWKLIYFEEFNTNSETMKRE
ncbi:MAG: GIY-YIG nuclease family protein [Ignavibacteriales bacterium]|nr:GIY-YIG nuclease family protein [Ignavibacteriales bacterium]